MKYFLFQGSGVEKQKGETFCVWPLQLYWNDIITGNIYEHVDLSDNSNKSQVNKEGKVENWREKNKQQNEKKKKQKQQKTKKWTRKKRKATQDMYKKSQDFEDNLIFYV